MSKTLRDKYSDVNKKMDNVIREANLEIGGLREKINEFEKEQQTLRKKTSELTDALQDKNRQFNKLQVCRSEGRKKTDIRIDLGRMSTRRSSVNRCSRLFRTVSRRTLIHLLA